jgi:hypothetical protein
VVERLITGIRDLSKAVETVERNRRTRQTSATPNIARDTPKALFTVMDEEMGFADRDLD